MAPKGIFSKGNLKIDSKYKTHNTGLIFVIEKLYSVLIERVYQNDQNRQIEHRTKHDFSKLTFFFYYNFGIKRVTQ